MLVSISEDDPVGPNPFTFREFHYLVSGYSLGLISGFLLGVIVMLEVFKRL